MGAAILHDSGAGTRRLSGEYRHDSKSYRHSADRLQCVLAARDAEHLGHFQDLGFIYHIDDISRDEPSTVTVNGKPFAVVPYTIRNNDIVRFDSPATTNAAYLQDLKDDFDFLYAEAAAVVE